MSKLINRMQLPITISNIHGEELTFERISKDEKGRDILVGTNKVSPKAGPPMHVHWLQDECLTVTQGKIGYQVLGQEPKYAGVGETVLFEAGVAHKFWNAGDTMLHCDAWVTPPNNIIYFLKEIYESTNRNNGRPGTFDAAYLLNRYRAEFKMYEIPGFVQKVIFPIALFFGRLTGKHKRFEKAPAPIKKRAY